MRNLCLSFLCLLLCCTTVAFAQPTSLSPLSSDSILTKADQMPYFSGCGSFANNTDDKRTCSDLELVNFLSRHLVYPEKAKHEGIEGTVFVSFIVDTLGIIKNPSVLTEIGGGCGKAALDVLWKMPHWEPAVHNGKKVKVRMNLPIQFFLRAKGWDEAEPFSLSWGTLNGKQTTKRQLLDNLSRKLYVRGPEGGNRYIGQLDFIFEKENRQISASSKGGISDELQKVVERAKKGGTFTVLASVQENGRFVTVERSFFVVK